MDNAELSAVMDLLEQESIQTSDLTHKATSGKDYKRLTRYANVTSFSQLEILDRCPRKFQKVKERAAFNQSYSEVSNVDFAYGHAVGAGVQNFMIHKNLDKAWLNAMLAWSADWDASIPKKRKNLWSALIAVQKFAAVWADQLEDWELLILPSGKPAIEVAFSLHCGNGFKHYLHMDIAVRNKRTKRIAVWDCKTSGFSEAEESLYANSTQALSYSLTLQAALPDEELMDYDVYYLVYSTTSREWTLLPFTKSPLEAAEFVKDLVLTQENITTWQDLNFYPKRGIACYDFMRRCEFFGECNMTEGKPLPVLAAEDEAEEVDYIIHLDEVIASLKARRGARS